MPPKPQAFSSFAILVLFVLGFTSPADASSIAESVRASLSKPETELNYVRAKVEFDRIVSPGSGEANVAIEVEKFADTARRLANNGTDIDKLKAVRQVLYDTGAWNGNRPFAYDQADPYGRDLNNKLLATYLRTRRGNCVSMPILHLLVAERLGLNVSL